MASLFVIRGRDKGKRFELTEPSLALGRDGSNPIQIHDTEVSRHHAEIASEDQRLFKLRDLDSANGTFLNSQKVEQQVPLRSGDRLQIGRTLMIFTGNEDHSSQSLSVDIVGQPGDPAGSQIVSSMSPNEGSDFLLAGGAPPANIADDSPWADRIRANLQIMYRTALAVSHTLDIDQLLHRIMELIFEWVEADRGCVVLVDPETDQLFPSVVRTREDGSANSEVEQKLAVSRTILDYVMQHNEGVLTTNARDDDRWDAGRSIVTMGVREAICVPMQGRYGVVGVIYIDTYTPPGELVQGQQRNSFSDEHLKLMVAIGHQAALAVEDTSYYSAMVQAERMAAIGQTITSLSHSIKNILQGIRGGSYLIDEGLKDNDHDIVRKGWSIVDKNQELISNLVLDMLSFSKEREPDLISSDLNRVVGDVVELMETRALDANVTLSWQPDPGMQDLMFDPEAIHQAVLNVITNAIDACKPIDGGQVEVVTEYLPASHVVRIVVSDNGPGIAPEDIDAIFSVFESRKGNRGTGLGLPVSRKILREHQGDVTVMSTPGSGSQFRLEMPL